MGQKRAGTWVSTGLSYRLGEGWYELAVGFSRLCECKRTLLVRWELLGAGTRRDGRGVVAGI